MPVVDRENTGFRLPPDQMKRLDKAARFCGLSRQKYIEAAVLAEVAETERRQLDRKATREERTQQTSTRTPEVNDGGPGGLGLAAALRRSTPEETRPPEAQAPVVVNVGTSTAAGGGGDSIERLASYVVAARDFERDQRLRHAVEVLRATAATDEERRVLAARLDEAIAAKTATETKQGTGILRSARVAFDKLAALTR